MSGHNPYEATKAPLIDDEPVVMRRPVVLGIALVIIVIGYGFQDLSKYKSWGFVGALIPPGALVLAIVMLFRPNTNRWYRARKA